MRSLKLTFNSSASGAAVLALPRKTATTILLQEFQTKLKVVEDLINKLGFSLREIQDTKKQKN